jgi:hypothetical protein
MVLKKVFYKLRKNRRLLWKNGRLCVKYELILDFILFC